MVDFKEQIESLISDLYYYGTPETHDVRMTTMEVYENLCTIIPPTGFDPFEVHEVLTLLGHKPQYEPKKKLIKVPDDNSEKKGKMKVTEIDYDDIRYYWYFLKK